MANFNQMSDQQLRDYIKQQRTDDDAIAELLVNRRSSDAEATWYSTAGVNETQHELWGRHRLD